MGFSKFSVVMSEMDASPTALPIRSRRRGHAVGSTAT
jgi:hypothetical protein